MHRGAHNASKEHYMQFPYNNDVFSESPLSQPM